MLEFVRNLLKGKIIKIWKNNQCEYYKVFDILSNEVLILEDATGSPKTINFNKLKLLNYDVDIEMEFDIK